MRLYRSHFLGGVIIVAAVHHPPAACASTRAGVPRNSGSCDLAGQQVDSSYGVRLYRLFWLRGVIIVARMPIRPPLVHPLAQGCLAIQGTCHLAGQQGDSPYGVRLYRLLFLSGVITVARMRCPLAACASTSAGVSRNLRSCYLAGPQGDSPYGVRLSRLHLLRGVIIVARMPFNPPLVHPLAQGCFASQGP